MFRPLYSHQDRIGADCQQLDRFSLEALVETEAPGSPISIMLEYWLHLRDGRPVPPCIDDFQMAKLWALKIPHRVLLVDCSADDPANFVIRHHPNDVAGQPWLFGAPITGQRIGGLPSKMHSRILQIDYQAVKTFTDIGYIRYSGVRQVVNGVYRDYVRLILPFTDAEGDVTMLAVAHRLRQPKTRNPALFPRLD